MLIIDPALKQFEGHPLSFPSPTGEGNGEGLIRSLNLASFRIHNGLRVDSQGTAVTATAPRAPGFRYYDLLVGGMVAVLLSSNLVHAAR
jgi:hypothetical protein